MKDTAYSAWELDNRRSAYADINALAGCETQPEDVADMYAWLLSQENAAENRNIAAADMWSAVRACERAADKIPVTWAS